MSIARAGRRADPLSPAPALPAAGNRRFALAAGGRQLAPVRPLPRLTSWRGAKAAVEWPGTRRLQPQLRLLALAAVFVAAWPLCQAGLGVWAAPSSKFSRRGERVRHQPHGGSHPHVVCSATIRCLVAWATVAWQAHVPNLVGNFRVTADVMVHASLQALRVDSFVSLPSRCGGDFDSDGTSTALGLCRLRPTFLRQIFRQRCWISNT